MRSTWVWMGILLTAACGLGAGLAFERSRKLNDLAQLEQEQSASAEREFVATLQGGYVDSELEQLDRHRFLVVRASEWRQGMFLSLVGAVFFAFASYTLASVIPFAQQLSEMADAPLAPAKKNPLQT